eukprot:2768163-Karenia_brevis.AAC.1
MGSAPMVTPPIQQSGTFNAKGLGEAVGSAPMVTPPTIAPPEMVGFCICGSGGCEGIVHQW